MTVMQAIAMGWTYFLTIMLTGFCLDQIRQILPAEKKTDEEAFILWCCAIITTLGLLVLFFYALWPMVFLFMTTVYYVIMAYESKGRRAQINMATAFVCLISWMFWFKFG